MPLGAAPIWADKQSTPRPLASPKTQWKEPQLAIQVYQVCLIRPPTVGSYIERVCHYLWHQFTSMQPLLQAQRIHLQIHYIRFPSRRDDLIFPELQTPHIRIIPAIALTLPTLL